MGILAVHRPRFAMELRPSIAMACPSTTRTKRSTHGRIGFEDVKLNADDLGFNGLIDFRRERIVTVHTGTPADDARIQMIRLGTDALLVTEEGLERTKPRLVGLIASSDIERELTHHGATGTDSSVGIEICAGELVTPWDDLPVMNYESLRTVTVHDHCEMFRNTGVKHLLVLEIHEDELVARGLLSRATFARNPRRTDIGSR